MGVIHNPILRGFNPDPSILRVGKDYYIATSTFEWFPGIQIHHSRDLINWELLTRPLERVSQLDLRGSPSSGGIWATCLSYSEGLFYLTYTQVKSLDWVYNDTHNYVITAPAITGPWSEPVYLNSSGFDPSLFHDEDGRKWLLNMVWDFRPGYERFAGITLQEYSPTKQALVGQPCYIFRGSPLGITEGPHLYKRAGYYYLMTAEGGTGPEHAVTMARSRSIDGPYQLDPAGPVLTAYGRPDLPLQKAGHASLVQSVEGEWFLAHLCARPLQPSGRCILGRETALQKCYWTADGWLRLAHGDSYPLSEVVMATPAQPVAAPLNITERDDFDSPTLNKHFQSLRTPVGPDWLSLSKRPGFLRLYGRESLSSKHRQSLVARRVQAFQVEIETALEFNPTNFQQMAGLTCFYDTQNYYYLCVSWDAQIGKYLTLYASDHPNRAEADPAYFQRLGLSRQQVRFERVAGLLSLGGARRCYLKLILNYAELQFYYSLDGQNWEPVGPILDASRLSDEYCQEGWFTGCFGGLCAQDLSGQGCAADFDYFTYREWAGELSAKPAQLLTPTAQRLLG